MVINIIYFNVKGVKEFLEKNGLVYTLRKPRSVGMTQAVTGSYYKHETFATVDVGLVEENITDYRRLYMYFPESGLVGSLVEGSLKWLELAHKMSGSTLNLYKVSIVYEMLL